MNENDQTASSSDGGSEDLQFLTNLTWSMVGLVVSLAGALAIALMCIGQGG